MTLKNNLRVACEGEQAIVALLIEQTGTSDGGDLPLLWRADIDELERLAACPASA